MQRPETYAEFQDRIFQRMRDMEDAQTYSVAAEIVKVAKQSGVTQRQIDRWLESGKSLQDLFAMISARMKQKLQAAGRIRPGQGRLTLSGAREV